MGFTKQNNLVNLHVDCKRESSELESGLPHGLKEQNLHGGSLKPHPPGAAELRVTMSNLVSGAIIMPGTPSLPVQGQKVS